MSDRDQPPLPSDLLPRYSEREVAAMLFVSVRRLQNWRFYGRGGPAYVKIGGSVRYCERDIVEFLERHTVR
ncbi:helix-turn-helix domain-containing protein [Microbacterium sp. NPDC096154]|uniref:helix-turn-helix domain-containing protein n=1 Tax=Microbacterium sp. NPDC096154 TaxID=3155549 RepID=UPI003332A079